MRHRVRSAKLGRNHNQRQALFKQQLNDLIVNEKLKTTVTKAKIIAGFMDKLITTAKKGTVAARRQLMAFLGRKVTAHKLMDEIVLRSKARTSGYTRLVRLGQRRGDNALIAKLEFVDKKETEAKKEPVKK